MRGILVIASAATMLVATAYGGARAPLRAQPLPQQPLPGGFDWHDALVGGAAVLGALLLLAGLVAVTRRSRRRKGQGMFACVGAALLLTAMSVTASAGAAGPDYKNFTTLPFSETDVSCTGETVDVSGVIRHHVVFVVDATGGFHGNGIFNGVATGTSSSGTRYVANFTDLLIQHFDPEDTPVAVTSPFSFRLISNDGTPNLHARASFHITVNAQGEVTVLMADFDIYCI